MPRHRDQKPALPPALTRTEKKAADIDESVKKTLAKSRAKDLGKIERLKALRLAQSTEAPAKPAEKGKRG
jgi:hypothetical protein